MTKPPNKQQSDFTSNMAGPEADRTNIKYSLPLPVEGAPIYFGGTTYCQQHPQGFNHQETLHAQAEALRSFDSASAGEGRVQNWKEKVPLRNQQGFTDELDGISTSAIISDPGLGNKNRNKPRQTLVRGTRVTLTRLMMKLNSVKNEEL